ncbi:nitroreductase family protein [Ectobacillus panaciterrae]|uniref:nitroreductase family protein n=1 Tax=Ectobacillus panaciterrae TaxID=363872 RepID=UPI00040BD432|nr:nitroreductase family protein [Ectobacillus panaciterrae]
MSSTVQTDFFTVVRERHSVKHYDAAHKLSEQEIKELLEIANSAPSAWNLQHWKFLAITDQTAKAKLLPIAYSQTQVVEASVVVAILGDLQANLKAEAVFEPDVQAGLLSEEVKANLVGQIEYTYANVPTAPRDEAIRNASLAAMQLMLAAKAKGLDSCPLGGYDADKFVEAFGVPARYVPVMLVAIGKAATPARPSVRLPVEQTIFWNLELSKKLAQSDF